MSPTVLGIDSSTQATKAVLVDADTGHVLEERRAAHPEGTEVDPAAWNRAVDVAAGPLLDRADAVSVAGQQHGMVLLDEDGTVVRPALLWNDTRSAPDAAQLVAELGGAAECARRLGSVLVASFTAAKLRWVARHEPEHARRTAAVMLPHDAVSLHLAAPGTTPFTDRGDASGTGYLDAETSTWDHGLLIRALGHDAALPRLPEHPAAVMAETRTGIPLAAGTGDNMAAALGLGLAPGEVSVSIGTSGVCATVSDTRSVDPTGAVTDFADATGRFLPMTTTLNAARILEAARTLLGVDHEELSRLALSSVPGSHGVTLLPYFDGERTPNRPHARATLTGLTTSTTREDVARAYIEGLLCSLADGIAALDGVRGVPAERVVLIGGGARSAAVQALAPAVLGREVTVAPPAEYAALGAARQAAWALTGADTPPAWDREASEPLRADPTPGVLDAYAELRDRTATWTDGE